MEIINQDIGGLSDLIYNIIVPLRGGALREFLQVGGFYFALV